MAPLRNLKLGKLAVTLYTFPLLAKFERTNKQILIWAFTLCIKNFPRTLYMFFSLALGLWLCHLLPGLLFIAPAFIAENHTAILLTVLDPYLPKPFEDDETEDNGGSEHDAEDKIVPPDDDMKWLL